MRLPVCCCLLLLVVAAGGQGFDDFDLGDALGDPTVKPQAGDATDSPADIPKKPTTKPQPGFGDAPRKPTPKPQPGGGGDGDAPRKPTPKPQPGGGGDEFRLEDVIGGHDPYAKPTNKPGRDGGGGGGGGGGGVIADSDLGEVDPNHPNHPSGHDDHPSGRALQPSAGGGEQGQGGGGENQNIVAGIVGAVAAAAVGAVSSFIAYQKKKLCFKGATDDPEAVNMDSPKGDQSDPQVQNSLLEK